MYHPPGPPYRLPPEGPDTTPTVLTPEPSGASMRERLQAFYRSRRWVLGLAIFVVSFGVFSLTAFNRIEGTSTDPHFVYLANTLNSMVAAAAGNQAAKRRRANRKPFELERPPPHDNDWASYWHIELPGGRHVNGFWLDRQGHGRFKLLDGRVMVLERSDLRRARRDRRYFVSFPPGPAVLMMPLAAIWGYRVNDVLFTIFFAALNVLLMFLLLRRLTVGGRTGRSRNDLLWLTLLFGFGTVHY